MALVLSGDARGSSENLIFASLARHMVREQESKKEGGENQEFVDRFADKA